MVNGRSIGVGGWQISARERELVDQALESGQLSYGPMTQRFERDFSALHGCRYGVFCNSGTSALHVALVALRETRHWRDGDEVIVPALTFVASVNVVRQAGLTPVLADVSPGTFTLDPQAAANAITTRTRCIMPVHLLGLPAEMAPLQSLCANRALSLLEDSCECMFAAYAGQPVGSFGETACFSSYVSHLLTTGVGGIATTNDAKLAAVMRSLCNHGADQTPDGSKPSSDDLLGSIENAFRFVRPGFSYRLTEMEAALGLGQLERHQHMQARRAKIIAQYRDAVAGFGSITLQQLPQHSTHSHMVFSLVCDSPQMATEFRYHLESQQIETRPLFPRPAHIITAQDLYPVARRLSTCGFYIGCHPYLTDAQVTAVSEALRTFLSRGKS